MIRYAINVKSKYTARFPLELCRHALISKLLCHSIIQIHVLLGDMIWHSLLALIQLLYNAAQNDL